MICPSNAPDVMPLEQGGTVERIRDVPDPFTIRAVRCNDHYAAEITVS